MGPKKPKEGEKEVPADRRPPGATDKALEQTRADLEARQKELQEAESKLQENVQRLSVISTLEEKIPRLEEALRRTNAKFRRCLQSDRPESTPAPSKARPGPEIPGLRELQQETQEVVMGILSTYYKKPRTKREQAEKAQLQAQLAELASETASAAGGRRQSAKKDKGKAKAEEEVIGTGPDPEMRCPIGISTEVFDKVLKTRAERMQIEEDIEGANDQLKPLREATAQAKADGVSKQQCLKLNRAIIKLNDKLVELLKKVEQEDEEWRVRREEEAKEREKQNSAEGEKPKRPGSAGKKK